MYSLVLLECKNRVVGNTDVRRPTKAKYKYLGPCATYVIKCSKSPSAAADIREDQKVLKYKNLSGDYFFTPIGIETFGSWGTRGHKLIKDIGKKLKESSGENRSTFFLTQRISMAIQRGNASCILNTVPPSIGLESIFEFVNHE